MALIPVFKKFTKEDFGKLGVEFSSSEWVEAEINGELYESNRFDARYHDFDNNKTLFLYVYMNENCNEVYAIDEVVLDVSEGDRYPIKETPFKKLLDFLTSKKLEVTVSCMAVYTSSIDVPGNLSLDEAIKYAKEHILEIPTGDLEYISDSDILDEENCNFAGED